MLILADRSYFGFPLWLAALETGANLLWRAPAGVAPIRLASRPEMNRGRQSRGIRIRPPAEPKRLPGQDQAQKLLNAKLAGRQPPPSHYVQKPHGRNPEI